MFAAPQVTLEDCHPRVAELRNRSLARLLQLPTDDPTGWERRKVIDDVALHACVESHYRDMRQVISIYNGLLVEGRDAEKKFDDAQHFAYTEGLDKLKKLCREAIASTQEHANQVRELELCKILSKLARADDDETSDFDQRFVRLHDAVVEKNLAKEKHTILRGAYKQLIGGPSPRECVPVIIDEELGLLA